MNELNWEAAQGAIVADVASSEPLKELLGAIGAREHRDPAAFIIYENGGPALPRSHPVWSAPCLYAAESARAFQYLGVTRRLERRVRASTGCASHEHLRHVIANHPDAVLYAIPTLNARRRWYDTQFIGLFPGMRNKAANPREDARRQAERVRMVLGRICAQPGISKTAAISGMAYGTGEHILARLVAAEMIYFVPGKCRQTGNPMLRYYPWPR